MNVPYSTVLVIVLYLAGITTFGSWLGRKRQSVSDYFLAERSVPWWAVAACIVATETSVLTFTSVPGFAYTGDWSFLQLAFGYIAGRLLIAAFLIPAYFQGRVFTSYELLHQKFGTSVRSVAASVFLVYRTLADGIRLHAAALVVAIAIGVPETYCVLLLAAAMILYTEEGGVKATVWTDVVQMIVYVFGAIVILYAVGSGLGESGIRSALSSAGQSGKLRVLVMSLDPSTTYTLLSGFVGGAFLTLATHGTDHYLVQRLLVARSARAASVGLVVSGFVVLAQFVLFLLIGTLLYEHYSGRTFPRGDEVLPHFIAESLPGPVLGFILAAVVAAALSPSLNSLASTTLKDFYVPYVDSDASERKQITLGRLFTVFWGLAQTLVALYAQRAPSALEAGLAVLSFASGPTVGAFLMAITNRDLRSLGVLIGMGMGLITPFLVNHWTPVAWTWNVAMGAVVTFAVGNTVSAALR
ncbi:MAG TPA: sodium/solute symporter [Vicinamibacteria bacterium]|nr:sodium/solute symporter [Vicinamibacteria bacterium]